MIEEFYGIAIRKKQNKNDCFWVNHNYQFEEIEFNLSSRYWIADPFIIEEGNKIYVFYEMFDYFRRKGVIAYSIVENNMASKPHIIIEEDCHLSFPFIWEENGKYFIMPESSGAKDLVVYEAVDFPIRWRKKQKLLDDVNLCDSIMIDDKKNEYIISSELDQKKQYFYCDVTNILYKKVKEGEYKVVRRMHSGDFGIRNAGGVIELNGVFYRPGQISTNGEYGQGLAIWKLDTEYSDEKCVFSAVAKEMINNINMKTVSRNKVVGIHTYNTSENYEIIDFKYFKKLNIMETLRNEIGAFPYKIAFHLKRLMNRELKL